MDLLRFDDLSSQRTAKRGLAELLPTLRANDGHLLDPRHRAALNRILGSPPEQVGLKDVRELFKDTTKRETALRVAILDAYRQVGDEDALSVVERLSKSPGQSPAQLRIKAAAIECLPYLKVRVGRQTAHSSLLRGSSAAAAAPDVTLLRAAVDHGSAPEGLLRAAPLPAFPE